MQHQGCKIVVLVYVKLLTDTDTLPRDGIKETILAFMIQHMRL